MEAKSSCESRTKRPLQSDAEGRQTRHRGGGKPCYDTDIKMETVIYKLDSRNKIVLPPADNTNTDEGFLRYVKKRVEQNDDFEDALANGNKRDNGKDKKRERNKKRHKHHDRESDTSGEERTTKRTWCSCRKYKTRKNSPRKRRHYTDDEDESAMARSYETPYAENYERNVQFCSCRRAPPPPSTFYVNTNTPRNSHWSADIRSNVQNVNNMEDQRICDAEDQEQMLKCLQAVLKKLCAISNADGAKLEIGVQPTMEHGYQQQMFTSPETSYQQYNNSNTAHGSGHYAGQENANRIDDGQGNGRYGGQTGGHYVGVKPYPYSEPAIDPRLRHPENFFYPSKLDENQTSSGFSQPVETRILGKQFDITGEQIPNQVVYDNVENPQPNQNNQETYYDEANQQYYKQRDSIDKPYPTEYNALNPTLIYVRDSSLPQSRLRESQDVTDLGQQYQPQNAPQVSTIREKEDVPAFKQQNSPRTSTKRASYESSSTADRQSDIIAAVRYSSKLNEAQANNLRASNMARMPTILVRHPKPIRSTSDEAQFLIVPNVQKSTQPTPSAARCPLYPFPTKNGLQNLSADDFRVIPNITILDYNPGNCGCERAAPACVRPQQAPAAGRAQSAPLCIPNQNESYEYILMRVKKEKPIC